MKNLNCLIIAGEKSGEEHAISFFDDISNNCGDVEFWGVGGELLKNKGVSLLYDLKDFSSWGFSEVIFKIPFYKKALENIENEVERRGTKVAILIDFQDFNLRLAKRLSRKGVKILYYVAPQAWAWKAWRTKALEKAVHTLFTIIPFEKKWFTERGVRKVYGVNHPLYLTYKKDLEGELPERSFNSMSEEINLLILPGSRDFEVKNLLPEYIQSLKNIRKERRVNAILVKSPNVREGLYTPYLEFFNEVYSDTDLAAALSKSHLCLAASGTVTLACALFEVPTIVTYKTSLLNEFIFYTFVNYEGFISLANIVHEKEVFPEFIQDRIDQTNLNKTLNKWINNGEAYSQVKETLRHTKELLQGDHSSPGLYMAEVIKGANQEAFL